MLKYLCIVVESEEERTNFVSRALFVPAESGNNTITIPFVLDFEHHALVRLIEDVDRFGDDTIKAGAFKATKPIEGLLSVAGRRSDVNGRTA